MLTYDDKLRLVNTPELKHPFKTTATIPTVTHKVQYSVQQLLVVCKFVFHVVAGMSY